MELSDKAVKEICSGATLRKSRRGDLILCEEGKGKNAPNSFEFICIKKGEICLATSLYSTGHTNYDSDINVKKMNECPYKKE